MHSNLHFAYMDGKFISLRSFKKEVLPRLRQTFDVELFNFIQDNNLTMNDLNHQIKIVDYYNHLADPDMFVTKESYVNSN